MNPSDDAVKAIRAAVDAGPSWAGTDAEIADALNAPAVPNPDPAPPSVPVPYSIDDVLGCFALDADPNTPDAARLDALFNSPAIVTFRDEVLAQDTDKVMGWLKFAAAAGRVTPAQFARVEALVGRTQADPSHPDRIGWARATIGREVDAFDVAAARPDSGPPPAPEPIPVPGPSPAPEPAPATDTTQIGPTEPPV